MPMPSPKHRLARLSAWMLALCAAVVVVMPAAVARGQVEPRGNVDLPRFPSVSPDGAWVVFSWRGDLWKVPSEGGSAIRLTAHPGNDLRSAFSPDGTRVAFDSDRDGSLNLYVMNADGTGVTQVTRSDRGVQLADFGTDGRGREVLTGEGRFEEDVYRASRPYMITTDREGLLTRVHDAFGSFPVVGPDGNLVAFTRGESDWARRHYRGSDNRDLWLFDRANGEFRRLTEWSGNDGKARWADVDTLVFLSDRENDAVNLYRISTDGDGVERLTNLTDRDVWEFDVSDDGSTAVFASWDSLHRLDLTDPNAEPTRIAIRAVEDDADNFELKSVNREVSEAALSPDGKTMAVVAYGEIFVRATGDEHAPTRRVTRSHAREKDLAWSPDGLHLYFTTDADGTDSIHRAGVALTRQEIKDSFKETLNGGAEEDDAGVKSLEQQAEAREEANANAGEAEDDDADDAKEDAKKDDAPAEVDPALDPSRWHDAWKFTLEPVVAAETNDRQAVPSPDGTRLAFRRGRGDLVLLDLATGEETSFFTGWDTDLEFVFSPDSRYLAYHVSDRDFNSDIWLAPVDGPHEPINVSRHPDNDYNPRFSADGKILSFVSERINEEYDVWMVYLDRDLEGYTPQELSDYYDAAVKAAKARKPLEVPGATTSEEPSPEPTAAPAPAPAVGPAAPVPAAEPPAANPVDPNAPVDPAAPPANPPAAPAGQDPPGTEPPAAPGPDPTPEPAADAAETPEQDEAAPAEPAFTREDLEEAYLRLRRITTLDGSEFNNEITPGGDRFIFTGNHGGEGLFSVKWDGTDQKRLAGSASVQGLSLTGDAIVLVDSGRAATVSPEGGKVEFVDVGDEIRIDLAEQSSQKFLEAARTLGEIFYHPTMKDLDWDAIARRYHDLAKKTRTANEFEYVADRFLGELNASHLGVYATGGYASPNRQASGRLGVETERTDGGFRVTRVYPDGPADVGVMALKPGDVITAVDLDPFAPGESLEESLEGRVNEETILDILRPREDGEPLALKVLITPVSSGRERDLVYDAWQRDNARKVAEWSDGRIGYLHIEGMNEPSLFEFERDLYAAAHGKDGLLIDVRNNGGGYTADLILASIMTKPHAYTVPRGSDPAFTDGYPQDRLFIQRYTKPVNMLCNEKSFSNAEIVSHAFKTLGRGNLVGQETYGGVISTGGTRLIDGTFLRLPFRGWYLLDGTDMENHGAVPDILVPQTPEAEAAERDEQLRAAVEDLLKRVDG